MAKITTHLFLSLLTAAALLAQAPDPTAAKKNREDKQQEQKTPEKEAGAIKQDGTTTIVGAMAPVDPNSYKIGPEDVIEIKVWREPELSGVFVVRPDGRITLPLAGELEASNKTPNDLKDEIIKGYSKFVQRPEVMVGLRQIGSKKYYLVGEVLRPGVYPLIVPTTLLEALDGSGGFREFANRKKIWVVRKGKRILFNYQDVIKGKKMEQNIYLENGDHVVVQ